MARRIINIKDQDIYYDYLTEKITGGNINNVHIKNKCSRKYVHNVIKRVEMQHEYKVSKNLRKQNWLYKYNHIQEKLNVKKRWTKQDRELQEALIRHLFYRNYNDTEIAKYTGVSLDNVKKILWG